jgi:tetratricopeptide (TPR) repeat protein
MAYNNRGSEYYNKKDYDRAIADYEAALKIDPNHPYAKDSLADANRRANRYDPSKFTVVPSSFKPSDYTKVDLFRAATNARDLQISSNKYDALNNQLQSMFALGLGGTYILQYVSDVTFVRQNGTDITFSSDDNAITQNMSIDQRSGLQAGQKVRIYYTIMRSPLTTWDVTAIERR